MNDVLTIRETVQRAKADGLPVSEYTLRRWVKTGAIPTRKSGAKALLYYPALVRYLQCADGGDNAPASDEVRTKLLPVSGIRRVDL